MQFNMERELHNQGRLEEFIESKPFLAKAYDYAKSAHEGKVRAQGIPYFTHCLAVARILNEEWGIENEEIIAAAFLHDTEEDAGVPVEAIRAEFGENVASWVEGVTQLNYEKGSLTKEEADKKTLKKVNDASYFEPQVGVIKLADRLHNMRTLEHMPVINQINKAKETLFYAKLAESLGMWDIMRELEDLSLKYFDPKEFEKYSGMRDKDPRTRPEFVAGFKSRLEVILKDAGVEARVEPRKNSLLRIKDKRGKYLPDKIDDLIRFGIVVKQGESEIETRNRVGIVLMALWNEFDTIEDKSRFDNFFFTPRDNGYSALHLTLKFDEGNIKVALTCEEKEIYNDRGILSLLNEKGVDLQKYALKLVITPTGEIKFFKPRATGVDYAYSISSRMGAMAEYMLINGERRELTEIIPNGAEIEIKFAEHRRSPKKGLKDFALPPAKILIGEQEDDQIKFEKTMEGKAMVEKIMRERGLTDFEDLSEIEEFQPIFDDILRLLGCKENVMDLYHKIGSDVMDITIFTEILDSEGITKKEMGVSTIYIEGHDQHGMSKAIIDKVTDSGGNIEFQKGNISKRNKTFSLKLIVENLTDEKEKEFAEAFRDDIRITKADIV